MMRVRFTIDTEKMDEYIQACISAGVQYGLGAKDPTPKATLPIDFDRIDCSGFVRQIIRHATNGGVILPDGSWAQSEWCKNYKTPEPEAATLEPIEYKNLNVEAFGPTRVVIAFYRPVGDAVGHVWLVHKGVTYESHGKAGPAHREWCDPVLMRLVTQAYILA